MTTPDDKVESVLPTRLMRASPGAVERAAALLAAGGLVAFPTETVYGLGADATDDTAVARLYAAKGRPSFNPLIVHVVDLAAARRIAAFDETALRLAAAFWPGPLTLVLPRLPACPVGMLATAGLDTLAIRVPQHLVARDILVAFGKPVVAPSANRSGTVSPTAAQHVQADLGGRIDLIVDGGPSPLGLESTIVACLDGAAVLRPGPIPRAAIEELLAQSLTVGRDELTGGAGPRPRAPGMLASHYAPRAAVRMNAVTIAAGEALLGFGPDLPGSVAQAAAILNLSERGLLIEASANLFAYLRQLDASGPRMIAVMPIPEEGLGEAINDRLRRAAAPRGSRARPQA
jgi:L-threonylcarbamoyladenylate synthase